MHLSNEILKIAKYFFRVHSGDELVKLGSDHQVEVCLFLGPRGSWDIGGQAKVSAKVVVNKIMARLKEGESAVEPQGAAAELLEREETPKKTAPSFVYA